MTIFKIHRRDSSHKIMRNGTTGKIMRSYYGDINIIRYEYGFRVTKLNTSGNLVWEKTIGGDWSDAGIALDVYENIYVATKRVNNKSVRKYDEEGTVIASYDTESDAYDIAVDKWSNFYVVGKRKTGTPNKSVWKFLSNGIIDWNYDTGDDTYGIAVDSVGNVYVVGKRSGNVSVWKIDDQGILLDTYDTKADTYDIAVDNQGKVLVVGDSWYNEETELYEDGGVWKLDSDLDYVWLYQRISYPDWPLVAVAVDDDRNVYAGGNLYQQHELYKLNENGSKIWSKQTASSMAVAVDAHHNVYAYDGYHCYDGVQKYDPDGNYIWCNSNAVNSFDIAVKPLI